MAKDFMADWMGRKKKRNINQLSRFTVKYDRYDHEDVQRLIKGIPDFDAYREKLADSKAGDLAYDVWQDGYLSFWKVDPEYYPDRDIRATHLINRFVMDEATKLPEHERLRTWTQGDDIGAALALNAMEPDLESIYDRLEEEIEKAKQLQQQMAQMQPLEDEERDLDEMMRQWTEENPDADPDAEQQARQDRMDEIQAMLEQMQQGVDESAQQLRDMLNQAAPSIKQSLKDAMGKAADHAETVVNMSDSWGMEPGQLHRLSAAERIEMAKKLNNPKFKKMADLIGPMKRLAFTENRRKITYMPEEIHDVTLGNNIRRLLSTELAKLADEDREMLFLKDFSQKKLLEYEMQGREKVGKGGIVYCHDGSGSMSGDREVWAKSVGICLLHLAKKQKRPFYGIQFSSAGQLYISDFRDSEDITPEKVIDFAEYFFGGGTDFMTPLNQAVKILLEEYNQFGFTKSDIVFASDGQSYVSDEWFDEFKKAQEKVNFAVWGINIGGRRTDEPMYKICDGKVASISSLVNGDNVREIFGGI